MAVPPPPPPPPSLLLFMTTLGTVIHLPRFASVPHWRHGSQEFLAALERRIAAGRLEAFLTADCSEAAGHRLFAPVAAQFPLIGAPLFDMTAGWGGSLAQQIIDRRCAQLGVPALRAMFVCPTHTGLGPIPDTVLVAPYAGRGETRAERSASRHAPPDATLDNLLAVVDAALATPDAAVADVVRRSDRFVPHRVPLEGRSMRVNPRPHGK